MSKRYGLFLVPLLSVLMLLGGCSGAGGEQQNTLHKTTSGGAEKPPRFEVIYEHGETKNLGGFSVIRDNATGQEYLAVTGMNGSPTVIMLKSPTAAAPGNK